MERDWSDAQIEAFIDTHDLESARRRRMANRREQLTSEEIRLAAQKILGIIGKKRGVRHGKN